jgi:hypothetical protein
MSKMVEQMSKCADKPCMVFRGYTYLLFRGHKYVVFICIWVCRTVTHLLCGRRDDVGPEEEYGVLLYVMHLGETFVVYLESLIVCGVMYLLNKWLFEKI